MFLSPTAGTLVKWLVTDMWSLVTPISRVVSKATAVCMKGDRVGAAGYDDEWRSCW